MLVSHKKNNKSRRFLEKFTACYSVPLKPNSQNVLWRRDLLLLTLSSSLVTLCPSSGCLAEEDVKWASLVDDINAYTYSYPVEVPSKKFLFKWVESRKPERYSSAAPLSPDARLRIVSERVDILDNLIISVTIGPPNIQFLKSKDKKTWAAKDVADSVLSDKSALRVTSSQRMSESSVLDAHTSEIDAEREGYLYSLSASTLSKQWTKMGPLLEQTVASFRLLPPTENYVPPYKDPWRFW
ncbi:Mog1/PsbP, alpha/beta/alpha sandwich [Corchorus olitorius]|uniref:Mog1/PsbP, alpha/beta/alpha sandwich n=1 Tax=Corchorus olitorius TaxID=93759 RepID=A0A1R3ID42_9ROSI|nr:Mog1/PsbP, alpha/beta/alpha sandwich [Corchorus olitorius]